MTQRGEKAKRILDEGFNDQYYRDLIVKIIREHQPVARAEINRLLLEKLPEVLTEKQKLEKIHNLLTNLSSKRKQIWNSGNRRYSQWIPSDGAKLGETKKNNRKQSLESNGGA